GSVRGLTWRLRSCTLSSDRDLCNEGRSNRHEETRRAEGMAALARPAGDGSRRRAHCLGARLGRLDDPPAPRRRGRDRFGRVDAVRTASAPAGQRLGWLLIRASPRFLSRPKEAASRSGSLASSLVRPAAYSRPAGLEAYLVARL